MKVFIVSALLVAAAMGAPSVVDNKVQNSAGVMSKIFGNCFDGEDVTTCLAIRGITALNRAARSNDIEILPGVTFKRDPSAPSRAGKSFSENEIAATLPADSQEKSGRLFDMALESATNFLGSHNLQVKFPTETGPEVARALEEGRGKIKKLAGPLLLAVGAKVLAILPLFVGGLVLLATKALFVAKIAFFLAAILGFQKLAGGYSGFNLLGKVAGGGSQGYSGAGASSWPAQNSQGWSAGGSSGSYPYARSYEAQDLAYSAQAPANKDQ